MIHRIYILKKTYHDYKYITLFNYWNGIMMILSFSSKHKKLGIQIIFTRGSNGHYKIDWR